ncbi:MAG: hypothetical protein ACE5G3_04440 [Gammaproteobacteria bacterium]
MVEDKTNSGDAVVTISSLEEYFHDSMDAAMATNRLVLEDHTTHYVVNLLTLFSRSEALYEHTEDGYRLRPLASMFADAIDAPNEVERNEGLRRIGDVALFVAGFFAAGLEKAAVDVDYYVYMGGGAYHSLSLHTRGSTRARALSPVFDELAAKFQDLVDVLNEIHEAARGESDASLLRVYELWVKTGSRRAARILREAGVCPMPQARVGFRH